MIGCMFARLGKLWRRCGHKTSDSSRCSISTLTSSHWWTAEAASRQDHLCATGLYQMF